MCAPHYPRHRRVGAGPSTLARSVQALLVQQTVGLCSKEDYARKRMALEAGGSSGEPVQGGAAAEVAAAEGAGAVEEKKKKKKKGKEKAGTLSFAMEDEVEIATLATCQRLLHLRTTARNR